MPRVTIYYITCDSVTAEPSVILASSDYEVVRERRDGIALAAAEGKDVCTEPHAIRHHEVMLP